MTTEKQIDPAVEQIRTIKRQMPSVYAAIQAKAAEIGGLAYELVRRGARGELGCFYACEKDIKVGTYWHVALTTDVALLVERYGMSFVCMWGESAIAPRLPEDPPTVQVQNAEVVGASIPRRNAEFRVFIDGVHAEDRAQGGPRMKGREVADGAD
ncbi:hypothetical protein FHT32_001255 [Variovorax sp. SG517]|uniref:hypothetical protein n=1 Tax=Variovorax sp. SG517 TaxID=2587117 RepID=UPI00159D880D|nr:hypothetical protein [Variovorax sp. SG517]NVM87616.1 hypothetical protein [Variovorax sp. SG517]